MAKIDSASDPDLESTRLVILIKNIHNLWGRKRITFQFKFCNTFQLKLFNNTFHLKYLFLLKTVGATV